MVSVNNLNPCKVKQYVAFLDMMLTLVMCFHGFTEWSTDWNFRTSLAKAIEGQRSIVTKLPDVLAQSRAFISGKSKRYMAW